MGAARRLAHRVVPDPRYYGWRVALVGMTCAALSGPGQSFLLSLYLEPLMAATGLERFGLSMLYSLTTLGAALLLPLVGAQADRSRGGRFLAAVLLGLAAAMTLLATSGAPLQLGLSLLLLRLLGQGAIGIGTLVLTVRWFERNRGRALALVTLGYGIGELSLPLLLLPLSSSLGWRVSLLLLAGTYAAIFAPMVVWAVREPSTAERHRQHVERADAAAPGTTWAVAATLRTPLFWALAAATAILPLTITALLFHQVAIFRELGHGPGAVALAMAGMAVGGVVGALLAGPLLERLPARFGLALALALQAVGLVAAVLWPTAAALPWVYGSAMGLANGASKIAGSLVWPESFGTGSLGAIKGVVNLVRNGSTAAGPPIAAALLAGGGARGLLVALAIVTAIVAVGTLPLRPPRPTSASEPATIDAAAAA
ncbi:MAG TPA: MFS transporter [Thermoanaerobaculia bacterium]|nr:MFS transporter [Thermoanaerobaculia bacterium]